MHRSSASFSSYLILLAGVALFAPRPACPREPLAVPVPPPPGEQRRAVPIATDPAGGRRSPIRLLRILAGRPRDVVQLQRLGLDILEREDRDRWLVAATDREIGQLRARDLRFTVLETDLESANRRGLGLAAPEVYHTFDEVVAELEELHATRPDLVAAPLSIGKSWEGRDLWAIKISDHPELDEDEPEVLFDALHHAREPIGMETLLHTMWFLVEHYDQDPEIRDLVDERELWFVPVVNPDGYAWGGLGGMWRKNRRPNPDGSFGVDLNRNYGYQWGYDDLGSSPVPESQTYRGPAPFSEPETAAMRDFVLSRNFATGMTLHTYSDLNLLPCGWAEVRPEDAAAYEEVARDLQELTGYPYGQPWELLYFSNGRTQDWLAHQGIMVIEPEIGSSADGFWPPAERVPVLAAKNLPALLHMARIAGGQPAPVALEVAEPSSTTANGFADPGETVQLVLTLRNKGLGDLHDLVVTVSSKSPQLVIGGGVHRVGSLPAQTTTRLDRQPIQASVSPDAAAGVPIIIDIAFAAPGRSLAPATIELVPGTPTRVFADDAEEGAARWIATQGWGISSGPEGDDRANGHVFTDSPHRSYSPNSNSILELSQPIDLSGVERAVLRYRECFAIEPWDDLCYVEARSPGRDWETLLTIPGGMERTLRDRSLSLDAFAGESEVTLRFRLTSNHSRQHDGWTIDDIEVLAYGGPSSGAAMVQGLPEAPVTDARPAPAGDTRSPTAE